MTIISPVSDQIIDFPSGSGSIELTAKVQANSKPKAKLNIDLSWPNFKMPIRQAPWDTQVTDNGDGTYTAKETLYPPYAWQLPSLDQVKRWFVFTLGSETAASGKTQIRTA